MTTVGSGTSGLGVGETGGATGVVAGGEVAPGAGTAGVGAGGVVATVGVFAGLSVAAVVVVSGLLTGWGCVVVVGSGSPGASTASSGVSLSRPINHLVNSS